MRSARVSYRAITLASVFAAIVLAAYFSSPPQARASHPTIYDNRVHWDFAAYYWHWGSTLEDHHTGFQLPANAAWWLTWQDACCPDSPWHTHYDTSAPNHIDTVFFTPTFVVGRAVPVYDGNAAFHMNTAQVHFNHYFFDNDGISSDDAMYRGSGTPPSYQADAWSVAAEEFGHVQNMNHFGGSCDTMGGITVEGTTCKRSTNQAERNAAIEAYNLMHP